MTDFLPPQRDLPPGRLETRSRHLLAEIGRPRRRNWPVPALAAASVAVAAAIALPLSLRDTPKTRVEVVYRPVRVIVLAPRSGSRPASQSLDLTSGHAGKPRTLFERFVAGLGAEGRHVRPAPQAHAAVPKAAALAALWPKLRRPSGAWLVRLKVNGRGRLVWLLAIRHGCVQSYGPVGGSYRTMWAGFVDATTGRPLFQITVGNGRARPC